MRGTWLFFSLFLIGCTTVRVDPEDPNPDETDPDTEPDPQATTLVGTWTGYVENFEFDDQSDRVELTITSETGGAVTGVIRFGDRPFYAPPTDPDAGYPPGYVSSYQGGGAPHPFSGFQFTVIQSTFEAGRLKLAVDRNEIWYAWCDLQTPILDEYNQNNYSCVPNWGYGAGQTGCFQPNPDTGMDEPVDCVKLELCDMHVCQCEASGCSVDQVPSVLFDFTVDLAAGTANGSTVDLGFDGDARFVRLTRAQP